MKSIRIFTPVDAHFSTLYLAARKKEGFVVSDEIVRLLPYPPKSHPQYAQWRFRRINSQKFCSYLQKMNSIEHVLELGCGNGWFSNEIAQVTSAQVLGLDINFPELEQANRVFVRENLEFGYGDIFRAVFANKFDVIVLNASAHYFPNFDQLMSRLKSLISDTGEIHLLDTHFYSNKLEANYAKQRTERYYNELDEREMSEFYFHHTQKDLKGFERVQYGKKLLTPLWKRNSPFGWYRWRLNSI